MTGYGLSLPLLILAVSSFMLWGFARQFKQLVKLTTIAEVAVVIEATVVVLGELGLLPLVETNPVAVLLIALLLFALIIQYVHSADIVRQYFDGGFLIVDWHLRFYKMPPIEVRKRSRKILDALDYELRLIKEAKSAELRDTLLDSLNANLSSIVLTMREWKKRNKKTLTELLEFAVSDFKSHPRKYLQTFYALRFARTNLDDPSTEFIKQEAPKLWEEAKKSEESDEEYLKALIGCLLNDANLDPEFSLMEEVIHYPNEQAIKAIERAFVETAQYLNQLGRGNMAKLTEKSLRRQGDEFLFRIMNESAQKGDSEAARRAGELRSFFLKFYGEVPS